MMIKILNVKMYFFEAMNVWLLIVLIFLKYTIVASRIVIIPSATEAIPIILANISPAGERLAFMLKCKLVTKKPTPITAIAVRIQAKYVRSLAKCCWIYLESIVALLLDPTVSLFISFLSPVKKTFLNRLTNIPNKVSTT